MERGKPILCLDFDGVLHSYASEWKGVDVVPDPPTPGMVDFLAHAIDHFDVQIFSSRSHQPGGQPAMENWLRKHVMDHYDCAFAGDPKDFDKAMKIVNGVKWPMEKPAAMITIDDRALTFDGTWPKIETLKAFKPWNKR